MRKELFDALSDQDSFGESELTDTEATKNPLLHFLLNWNKPIGAIKAPSGLPDLFICQFQVEEGLFAYSTIGMSSQSLPAIKSGTTQEVEHRVELFLYSNTTSIELVESLIGLARYPFVHNVDYGWGHTIRGTKPMLPSSQLTDVLLLPPIKEPKSFYAFHLDSKIHVDVLWVMPLYRSETIFLRTHSWKELLNRMIDGELDTADFGRTSIV